MREIKFRCWDKTENKMWHVDGFNLLRGSSWVAKLADSNPPFIKDLSECDGVLMQFTGLKDKTGKDIYEGDIVTSTKGEYQVNGLVKYSAPVFEVVDEYDKWLESLDNSVEVIGNIYENPESLSPHPQEKEEVGG